MSLMQEFREGDFQRRQEVAALKEETARRLEGLRQSLAQRRQKVATLRQETAAMLHGFREADARRPQEVAALRQEVWGGGPSGPQPMPEPARHAARRKKRG